MSYSVQISENSHVASGVDCLMMSPDGYVDAVVEFYADAQQAMAYVYAPLGQVPADTPLPMCGMEMDEYWRLEREGRISSKYELQLDSRAQTLFRVEDMGGGTSWLVSFDDSHPGLRFGQVYVCQPNGRINPKATVTPPASFGNLCEFWNYVTARPNAYLENYDQIGRATFDLPERENIMLILDVGGIVRSQQAVAEV